MKKLLFCLTVVTSLAVMPVFADETSSDETLANDNSQGLPSEIESEESFKAFATEIESAEKNT